MTIDAFLNKLKENENIDFNELMALIDLHYTFTESAFDNHTLHNKAGENSGSCKLFAFAKLHQLNQAQTLRCFGDYYQKEVLLNPQGNNHQNIRSFIKKGWQGIVFEGIPLVTKPVFSA